MASRLHPKRVLKEKRFEKVQRRRLGRFWIFARASTGGQTCPTFWAPLVGRDVLGLQTKRFTMYQGLTQFGLASIRTFLGARVSGTPQKKD